LFSVAYHLLFESSQQTEEQAEARQKVRARLRDVEYEAETGMPAITQWMPPANEL